MGEKRRKRWLRAIVIAGGTVLALVVGAYGWGLQTAMSWQLRHQAKRFPVLDLTPQPLPDLKPNSAKGMTLSDAGLTFEVPWDDLDPQKTKYVGRIAVFAFHSGRVVEFFPPSPTNEDLLSTAEKSMGDNKGTLRELFGPDTVQTNYVFHNRMLEATPSMVKPWMSSRNAMRASFLLMLKGVSAVGGETGIFRIEANGWHGFQFDDPAKRTKQIALEVYDSLDRHVEIIFRPSAKNPDAGIAQADVSRVIVTLKPTDQLATQAGNLPGNSSASN